MPGLRDREEGSALLLAMPLLVLAAVVAIVAVDLTGYLVAAARAQAAADAAALAAASVAHPQRAAAGDPVREARRVASASAARLESCVCRRGDRVVSVEVSVPVRAMIAGRFAGGRVSATAQATMVPP